MIRLLGSGLVSAPAVRLDGEQAYLRPAQARDWQEWAELRARSRGFLTPWEPTWPADTLSRAAFLRRLRRQGTEWREDEAYSFLTFEKRFDTLVGGLGLGNVRRGVAQSATLGYWVGQAYARQGFTGAAVRLALDFAFGRLGLHRIEASCLPNNLPSRGLLEKLGFHYEGFARGYLRINGDWCDHRLYAILKEDWSG
ncbi:MAG: GNAT family N-acetyltransferase [Azospirillum sp.]|nr:GNAT family N-acetyltransferase [Azospirillum sp.]